MKLTTADIKELILECASDGQRHTVREYKDYISLKQGNEFTKGQLSGAIFQLSEGGILKSTERGAYTINEAAVPSVNLEISNDESGTDESEAFREKVLNCLREMNEQLAGIVKDTNVLELNNEGFELLREVKQLSNLIGNVGVVRK